MRIQIYHTKQIQFCRLQLNKYMNPLLRNLLKIFALFTLITLSLSAEEFSPKRKIAYGITHSLANQFEKNYGLSFSGVSEASKEGKYDRLGLIFTTKQVLTKEEGKQLILKCVEESLSAFNSNYGFRTYMKDYPFTGKNLNICIHVEPPNRSVYYPDIRVFTFSNDSIDYATKLNENSRFVYETDTTF